MGFSIEKTDGSPITLQEVILGLARLCPEFRKTPPLGLVSANRLSRRAHARDCNHLPDEAVCEYFATLEGAAAQGYSPCSLCFPKFSFNSIPDYRTERALGLAARADLLARCPEQPAHPELARVRESGRRVLARWPMPLRGYDYRFGIMREDAPNASACPTGMIFVSTGLLEIIESESELDAVMAHEITHCERRHGYQEYRSELANRAGVGLAALVVGAAAISQNAKPTTVDALMQAAIDIGTIATRIALIGHTRNNENEADAIALLYMTNAGLADGTRGFASAMAKFQYAETTDGQLPSRADAFSTHPDIEARLLRSAKTRVGLYPEGTIFDGLDSDGEAIYTLKLTAWSIAPLGAPTGERSNFGDPALTPPPQVIESRIYATLECAPESSKRAFVNGITLVKGAQRRLMDNYEDTEARADGVVAMNFVARNLEERFLLEVGDVQIDLNGVTKWVRRTASGQ